MARAPQNPKKVEALNHEQAKRLNIPTAELQSAAEMQEEGDPQAPVHYARAEKLEEGETRARDEDLDPQIIWRGMRITLTDEQCRQLQETGEIEIGEAQLTWRGKDRQDWSDLVVTAPPLYIQEKVHPKAIIDGLSKIGQEDWKFDSDAPDLFADFNGLDDPEARTEFYAHSQHWSNRMILGDSLQVMASLAEREQLRGKVQCIYFDPPYGIKFNSNWQVSTQSRDVKDGKQADISREPEQVKAFRDTWKDGIHSYLTYLRDRLTVARDLLTESGSIFVQIGDENVHRVRALMDEVFGEENFVSQIDIVKTTSATAKYLAGVSDKVLWFSKSLDQAKFRRCWVDKGTDIQGYDYFMDISGRLKNISSNSDGVVASLDNLTSQSGGETTKINVHFNGEEFIPASGGWKTSQSGLDTLKRAGRLGIKGKTLRYVRLMTDFPVKPVSNLWADITQGGFTSSDKLYIVQTTEKIVQRCILMATDPGDLVLDPTCGSGTTATVAEQWGRRWITIDTSRVALALARTRMMSAKYPYYLLADSPEGRAKEQSITNKVQPSSPTHGDINLGFVYERAPHITLKSIANNAEIDVIWETWQETLEPLRTELNNRLGTNWEEWQIPREKILPWHEEAVALHAKILKLKSPKTKETRLKELNHLLGKDFTLETLPEHPGEPMPEAAHELHEKWWQARIARQKEFDESIARAADVEYLYDRPYEDKSRVRVAGPFTVESLSPHRVNPYDDEDSEPGAHRRTKSSTPETDFAEIILEHLKTTGVHQTDKDDSIHFSSITGWSGEYICAEAHFTEGEGGEMRRAAILIGPEYGTLQRPDLLAAAREASEARFDVLIACAFSYDAHASELPRLGPLPILKAKMNPDLHMGGQLKNTGKGNLFVIFGEPDIDIIPEGEGKLMIRINGVDVFDPNTGDIRSNDTDGIAAWFIDTDYNEESFFVRHAYFLGSGDPYKSLKTALKAEIDKDAWETIYSDTSRPFPRPKSGRIAVKVINHFGDEVMKVFRI